MTETLQPENDLGTNIDQQESYLGINTIKYWDLVNSQEKKGLCKIVTSKITMEDDSVFIFREINPSHQTSDVSIDFSPPLATKVNGYNTYVGIKLGKLGIPSRIIGTDQTHRHSLRHAAHATHHILNQADTMTDNREKGKSIIIGYSMGAMKAMGMLATAHLYDRDIPFTLGLDPCLAQKVHYNQVSPLQLALYMARETQELTKIVVNDLIKEDFMKGLKRDVHYLDSINFSPQFLLNIIDKWITLSSGEAGVLAQEIPLSASVILHFFKNSRFNDRSIFSQILAHHPNVNIITEDAYHISGSSYQVVDKVVTKLALAQRLIAEKSKPADMISALSSHLI